MTRKPVTSKTKAAENLAVIVTRDIKLSRQVQAQKLESWRTYFEAGDRVALFSALRTCAKHNIPMPEWVSRAFISGYDKVINGDVASWDEAFGAPYPKGVHLSRIRQARLKRSAVWMEVAEERKLGSSINRELFERVGKKLGLGKTRAEELFYEVCRLVGGIPGKE